MPFLWIRRVNTCDLLIDFNEAYDAYIFGAKLLEKYEDHDVLPWKDTSDFFMGQTPSLQLLIEDDDFVPDQQWWHMGAAWVSEEEALALGEDDMPEGFEPGESSVPWVRNTSTREELDAEIDSYMKEYREVAQAIKSDVF
jgi:hypothetical protein